MNNTNIHTYRGSLCPKYEPKLFTGKGRRICDSNSHINSYGKAIQYTSTPNRMNTLALSNNFVVNNTLSPRRQHNLSAPFSQNSDNQFTGTQRIFIFEGRPYSPDKYRKLMLESGAKEYKPNCWQKTISYTINGRTYPAEMGMEKVMQLNGFYKNTVHFNDGSSDQAWCRVVQSKNSLTSPNITNVTQGVYNPVPYTRKDTQGVHSPAPYARKDTRGVYTPEPFARRNLQDNHIPIQLDSYPETRFSSVHGGTIPKWAFNPNK